MDDKNDKIKGIIEAAVKRAVAETEIKNRRKERERIFHNTQKLMESYREMRLHLETAISEADEMGNGEFAALMTDDVHLDSVRRSKMRTAMMVENIDRAMIEIEAEYERNGTSYKYTAFKMHYIDGATYEDISECLNCGKNTPSRWSKEIMRKMSIKLFGVDGICADW